MNALKTRATHGKYWINGNERTRTRNWTVRYGEYEDIYTRAGEILEKISKSQKFWVGYEPTEREDDCSCEQICSYCKAQMTKRVNERLSEGAEIGYQHDGTPIMYERVSKTKIFLYYV